MNKITIIKISTAVAFAFTLLAISQSAFAYSPPTANAGPDVYVASNQSVTLDGSGYDPNGGTLTYYWSCNGGTLSNYDIAEPLFTAPSVSQASYTCTLNVTDNYGLSATDSATVFVNSNNNNNNGSYSVQTNAATNITTYQATLNGYLYTPNNYNTTNYVWFQYGTDTTYGSTTGQETLSASGSFAQTVSGLTSGITYHFRAASQTSNGETIYGQDMTFVSYNNGNSNGSFSVQTNAATNILSNQATLNGDLYGNNSNTTTYVWFEYGTSTSYGSTTSQQPLNYSNYTNAFSQVIQNLSYNTIYHFRADAQGPYGIVYGQDMEFDSNGSNYYGNGGNGNGSLSVTKQVINLTSGNLNWQSSVNANPGDVLSFAVTLQSTGEVDNVVVRDSLPANLIYLGRLTVNATQNYSGSIASGINIGSVYANQPVVVAYQAQVAPASSFSYGTSSLSNNVTVTSNEAGTQSASASVIINNTLVNTIAYGPTSVSTGLTNNFLTDSFFLPLLLIILGSWLYFSGNIYKFADWIDAKLKN